MTLINIAEVKQGSHITLHYRLSLVNGADIVNTFNQRPATLLLGSGQLASPLEAILIGMKVASHSTFRLTPQQAFGVRNPALIQKVSLAALRTHGVDNDQLKPGNIVEFNAPDASLYAGVLKEIGADWALFDFNHPLAEQILLFEVQIIGIL
jgi:FKBP-type peptidyl-prolyl cis-trans isomerase SlpA